LDIFDFNNYENHGHSRIFAISSQKGGVGKTTTAINTAAYLSEYGYKVILIDLDAQCNCTSGVGIDYSNVDDSVYDIFVSNKNPNKIILNTLYDNLKILPSSWKLSNADSELAFLNGKEFRLKDAIEKIEYNFDFIIIDCPASLGILTINAFAASTKVLIPVQCEFYALEGISRLTEAINSVKSMFNSKLDIMGIVLTMYTGTRLSKQVIKEINKYFPGKIFNTIIPKNICLAEAPSIGKPIKAYEPMCKGALAYEDLTKEILESETKIDITDRRVYSSSSYSLKNFWNTGAPPRHAVRSHKKVI
jgi:chromosome partitioning protein